MATRQISSRPRKIEVSPRNRGGGTHPKRKQKTGSTEHVYGVSLPESLHEAIETERGNLSKAESLLGCLVISMEYETDCVTAPYYPDVAQIARDLVRQSINGLDSLALQKCLLRNRVKEEPDLLRIGTCSLFGQGEPNAPSVYGCSHLPRTSAALLVEVL